MRVRRVRCPEDAERARVQRVCAAAQHAVLFHYARTRTRSRSNSPRTHINRERRTYADGRRGPIYGVNLANTPKWRWAMSYFGQCTVCRKFGTCQTHA